jgi:hypothetical protein
MLLITLKVRKINNMRNNQRETRTIERPVETPVKTPSPTKNPSKIDIPKPNEDEKGKPKA